MRRYLFWAREIVFGILGLPYLLIFLGFMVWQQSVSGLRARQHGKVKRILDMVEQGTLCPDDGVVILPPNLAFASCRGKAYVLRRKDLLLIFVPVWVGKGNNVAGNVLCNRPLAPTDMHRGTFGGVAIEVPYSQFLDAHYTYGVGINEVVIDEQWGDRGYFVSNTLS